MRSDLKASPSVVRLLSPLPEMPLPSAVLLLSLRTCHLSIREDGFQLSAWAGRTVTYMVGHFGPPLLQAFVTPAI